MEEWKDIKGYEGLYQISNLGRVKSLSRIDSRGHKLNEKILKPKIRGYGYKAVMLSKNNIHKLYYIHRLVAEAFIPNPDNLPCVNHIDENKNNNCIENLEWCTRKYNTNYGTRSKRQSEKMKGKYTGSNHPQARKIKCITTGEIFITIKEACEKYKIKQPSITACCKGKIKSAGKHPITGEKLVWKYID